METVFDEIDIEHIHRPRINVGILISGTGSNMKRLIEQSQSRGSYCHVGLVISNKEGVKGLETAASMGVETLVIPHGNCREEFELKITKVKKNNDIFKGIISRCSSHEATKLFCLEAILVMKQSSY